MTHAKLLELLADMSLDEKIGQLTLLQVSSCIDGTPVPFGPMVDMNVTPEHMSLEGCFGCNEAPEPAAYAKVVRAMTAAHPHHIPPMMMRDVIHGFRTIFPLPLAVGCTFDEKYAEAMGRVSAVEGAAIVRGFRGEGIDRPDSLAPVSNILRHTDCVRQVRNTPRSM